MSDNRIELQMKKLQDEGKKAFITYITAGLPDYAATKAIIKAQEGITDVIELGIPFSDPTADGPVIQQASYEAILNGATLKKTFELMDELRSEGSTQPIVFMMYYNTIVNFGLNEFAGRCKSAGVDGLIVPDLPFEEQDALKDALSATDNATILIQLVSPISADRIPQILADAKGFVYCVSAMGVTGQGGTYHKDVTDYLKSVKSVSKIPVMMGFGIRTATDVEPMKDCIDGAIVGTHFINLLREAGFDSKAAAEYAGTFKKEMNSI